MAGVFVVYIFVILALGRAAALIHIRIFDIPVFLTEMVLILCLPLAVRAWHELWSEGDRVVVGLWSGFYLIVWIWGIDAMFNPRGPLIVRDIVYLFYPWMFFATVGAVKRLLPRYSRFFIGAFVLANATMILLGLAKMGWPIPLLQKPFLTHPLKMMNIGLTCGFAVVFWLVYAMQQRSSSWMTVVCVLWSALNIVMIILSASRTFWVAAFTALLCLLWFFRGRVIRLLLLTLIIGGMMFVILSRGLSSFQSSQLKWVHEKTKTFKTVASSIMPLQSKNRIETTSSPSHEPALSPEPEVSRGAETAPRFSDESSRPVALKIETTIPFPERIKSMMGSTAVDNIIWRLDLWSQYIQAGMARPWIGNGIGVMPRLVLWGDIKSEVKGYFVDSGLVPAHNMWVTIFYKFGLLGGGLMAGFIGAVFISAYRIWKSLHKHNLRDVLAGGMVCCLFWLVAALFFDMVDSPPTTVFFWISHGFLVWLVLQSKQAVSLIR